MEGDRVNDFGLRPITLALIWLLMVLLRMVSCPLLG